MGWPPTHAMLAATRTRKRKLSADHDTADAPFETVEETEEVEEMDVEVTTDRAVHPSFETVGETCRSQ
jgi:hypothetical protein